MTPQQHRMGRAALGLPNNKRTSYRNRHYTRGEGARHNEWAALADNGLAKRTQHDGQTIFALTAEGAALVLADGETVRAEDLV